MAFASQGVKSGKKGTEKTDNLAGYCATPMITHIKPTMQLFFRSQSGLIGVSAAWLLAAAYAGEPMLPSRGAAMDSKLDLWGEAAMHQSSGAS